MYVFCVCRRWRDNNWDTDEDTVWVWVHPSASSEATRAHRWIKEPISSAVLSCTRRFVIARPAAKCLYATCEHALGCVACFCGTWSSPAMTGIEINNHFSASNFSHCGESPLSWNCRAPPSHTQAHKARAHTRVHQFYVHPLSGSTEETVCIQPVVYSWERLLFSI